MSKPNEKAVAKAAEKLELAAREHFRAWNEAKKWIDADLAAYEQRMGRRLRAAAVRYTRALDKAKGQ